MTGWSGLCSKKIILAGHSLKHRMKPSTLQSDLSAKLSVKKNIAKARTTSFFFFFFFWGGGGGDGEGGCILAVIQPTFWFETCVIPVLLYGCETWILDHPCLMHGSGEFPS